MLGPDPIAEWLAQEGPRLPVAELIDGVARRLAAAGVPIDRASLHLRLLDPQFRGCRWNGAPTGRSRRCTASMASN
ncbi:hypothetical protein ACFQ4K_16230 [Tistrella bauzanensis]